MLIYYYMLVSCLICSIVSFVADFKDLIGYYTNLIDFDKRKHLEV